jgi:hypothetical protein
MVAQNGGAKKSSISANSKPPKPVGSASPLENEARALVKEHWGKLLRQCADPNNRDASYFYYSESEWWRITGGRITRTNYFGSPLRKNGLLLVELKGFSFSFDPRAITEADRMNGITFRADSAISARLVRMRVMNVLWSDWSVWGDVSNPDGFTVGRPLNVEFWRERSRWKLHEGLGAWSR